MRNYRRYNSIDYPGLLGSFIASWILHCALFAIALTTTIYYPPTASREIISVDILFATPGSGAPALPLQETAQDTILPSATHEEVKKSEATEQTEIHGNLDLLTIVATKPVKEKIAPPDIPPPPANPPKVKLVSQPTSSSPAIVPAIVKTPEIKPVSARQPTVTEVTPPVNMTIQSHLLEQTDQEKQSLEHENIRRQQDAELKESQAKMIEEARAAKMASAAELEKEAAEKERIRGLQEAAQKAAVARALEKARIERIARVAELEKLEAEKAVKARQAVEKARIERERAEQALREQLGRMKKEAERAAREKLTRERAAADLVAKEKLEQARQAASARESVNSPARKTTTSSKGSDTSKTDAAAVPTATLAKPLTTSVVTNTEKNLPQDQKELKGLALPPVHGDIKLIMVSREDLIVKVLFVSHPKARHDKPLSKKEAQDQQKVTPVIVRTAQDTLEAVIERSREGVYIFLVEQKGSKPVSGKFSIKVFESRSRFVAEREISGKTEVARLLMPEGILWEDVTAFSGTIEDSDSVTRFNAESGLVWKEYRR